MELKAHWRNCVLPQEQKQRVERDLEEFLIAHFEGASNAFNCKHDFEAQHRPPGHRWHIGITKAISFASRDMSPHERSAFKPALTFLDD